MNTVKLVCMVIVGFVVLCGVPVAAGDFYVISAKSSGGEVTTVFFEGQDNDTTAKRYAGIAGAQDSSTVKKNRFPMTRAGTIKNFTLYIQENNLSEKTVAITLEKNGSDTDISAAYNSSTPLGVTTISGEVSYAAGDTFSIYAQGNIDESNNLTFTGAFDIEY